MKYVELVGVLKKLPLEVLDESEVGEYARRIATYVTGEEMLKIKLENIDIDDHAVMSIIERIGINEPLQYILGYEWFGPLKINVDKNVLIPRPETVELVYHIRDFIKENNLTGSKLRVLDIGTGSGCIALLLKYLCPQAEVVALDCSEKALAIASRNASELGLHVDFIIEDILNPTQTHALYDIIVSNPPYIVESEKTEMHARVLGYEPHQALFVTNSDALQFYRAIHQFSMKHLQRSGSLFLELGKDHASKVADYFMSMSYLVQLYEDMYGLPRILKVSIDEPNP